MPNNKTRQYLLPLVLAIAPESLVRRFRYNAQDSAFVQCSCSPQAILARSRGEYVPLCDDMPWRCPLRPSDRKTPVV